MEPAADFRKLRTELCWAYADEPLERRHRLSNPPWNSAWFVERGSVRVLTADETVEVPAGAFALPRLVTRTHEFAPGTRIRSIGFIARWSVGWPLLDLPGTLVLRGAPATRLGAANLRLVRAAHRRDRGDRRGRIAPPTPARHFALQEAFYGWLRELVRVGAAHGLTLREAPRDPRTEALLDALEAWPLDRPLTLAALARPLALSPRRLQQEIRARLGLTARAYLERRRVELAVRELRSGGRSMKEIAALTGFRHEANFSLWFRRLRGEGPRAFRQSGRSL